MTSWVLAIDFGTSSTLAAARFGDRSPEVVEILGERRVPSMVYVDFDGRVVVGRPAQDLGKVHPDRLLLTPKSRLGSPTAVVLGGKPYGIVDLVAAVLHHVYHEAVESFGDPPEAVRLTYPASWSAPRRDQLLAAASRAGLPNPALVPEPVAAALTYAGELALADGAFVLVYDLGGGTFDTVALQAQGPDFAIVGRPTGDQHLGGELFDELVMNHLGEQLDPAVWEQLQVSDEPAWLQAAAALRAEATRAKEALTTHPSVQVRVGLPHGVASPTITRTDFDALVRPHLTESIALMQRCIVDAGLRPVDLSAIYLVGGASRTPLVPTLVAEAFPDVRVARRGDPKAVVALGATQAEINPDRWVRRSTDPGATYLATAAPLPAAAPPTAPSAPVAPEAPPTIAPPSPAPASPPHSTPRRSPKAAVLIGVLALVAVVAGALVLRRGGGDGDATALDTGAATSTTVAGTAAGGPASSGGTARLPSGDGMVAIAAGDYPLGAESPDLSESSRRTVSVKAFSLDLHEVTNKQYKAFVDQANGARPLPGVWDRAGPPADLLEHPVRGVNYDWASAYCAALGKRLPTEIEWEVAAGGKDGQRYAWGNDLAAVTLPVDRTYPVMSQPQNKSAFGVFDLTGNVWEWVSDTYDTNKVKPTERVLRGGQNGFLRTNWTRLPIEPNSSSSVAVAGFRCAASAVDNSTPALTFGSYKRPGEPVVPTTTVKAGFVAYDDFSDPASGWLERTTAAWRFGYHPNKYFHLETKQPNQTVVALSPVGMPSAAKVSVSTSAEIEPPLTEKGGQYEFGLVLRAPDGQNAQPASYVALVVNPRAQTWEAYVKNADGSRTRIDGRGIGNVSENRPISMRIEDFGDHLEFSVNGLKVGQSRPGQVTVQGSGTGFVLSSNGESTKAHIHYSFFGIEA